LAASRALKQALNEEAAAGSLLHTHGLWLMPNIYPAIAARRSGSLFGVSPRGMLSPAAMQFSRAKKKLFWLMVQKSALKEATFFHATSIGELEDIRHAGFRTPVALIPNGIDVPAALVPLAAEGPLTVLHLGRLHPKKGLDRLIAAWARIEGDFAEWNLRIVGPSEGGYLAALRTQAQNAGLERVTFEGPIFGKPKLIAYQTAEVFVLPTLNENFGLVVAEALAAGTPAICTKGAPWEGLERHHCGWWIDHGVDALETSLRDAMTRSREQRLAMGQRGRAWVRREFAWEAIGREMADVYRWASSQAPRPPCVHLT
jgi:glycosyltransferase involved in cell wall biosynthesis